MSGSIDGGSWIADTWVDRVVFNGTTAVAPQAGSYTVALERAAGLPGYAVCTVSKAGSVQLAARLPGAGTWSKSGRISAHGEFPMFMPLAENTQLIVGRSLFNAGLWSECTGAWTWFKSGGATNLAVHGGHYSTPPTNAPVLSSESITVEFQGSGLTNNIVFTIEIGLNRKVSATNTIGQRISLQFGANGVFSGTLAGVSWAGPIPFRGIVLQRSNTGIGSFSLGTTRGTVRLKQALQ